MVRNLCGRDVGSLVLRIGLGAIFIVHGYQKITKEWGSAWEPELGIGTTFQLLVAWGEFVGGIAVLLGFCTRIAAVPLICSMLGALYIVGTTQGFLGAQTGPPMPGGTYTKVGAEYNLALLTQSLAVLFLGGGAFSVDRCLWGRKAAGKEMAAGTAGLSSSLPPAPAVKA